MDDGERRDLGDHAGDGRIEVVGDLVERAAGVEGDREEVRAVGREGEQRERIARPRRREAEGLGHRDGDPQVLEALAVGELEAEVALVEDQHHERAAEPADRDDEARALGHVALRPPRRHAAGGRDGVGEDLVAGPAREELAAVGREDEVGRGRDVHRRAGRRRGALERVAEQARARGLVGQIEIDLARRR